MSKGLWQYIISVKNETEDDKKKNEEVKHLLYLSMEPAQITATGSCANAYELWQKLKENYEGAESDLSNTLLAEFLAFRYRKGESIINYCGRFEMAPIGHKTKLYWSRLGEATKRSRVSVCVSGPMWKRQG